MANNPRTFLDLSLGDNALGRVVFELFKEDVPKTVENFRCLCTGEKGSSATSGKPLHYKDSPLHRVIDGFMIQGGDFTQGTGRGGESIYGSPFEDEKLDTEIDQAGLLVMANKGPDTNGSQFFITLAPAPHLNGKHVLFGRVVAGMQHIEAVAKTPVDPKDRPLSPVLITHCGELERRVKAKPPPRERSASVSSAASGSSSSSSGSSSDSEAEERRRRRRKEAKRKRKEEKREKKRAKRKQRHGSDASAEDRRRSASPGTPKTIEPALSDERRAELERRREMLMQEMEREKELERRERRRREEERADGRVQRKGRGAMRWRDQDDGSRSGMRAWN